MASTNVRSGPPTNLNTGAYITTAGTEGSTAREITLATGAGTNRGQYARPVIFQNLDGTNVVFVKVNETGASATDCHFRLAANEHLILEKINVETISLFMSAGDYDTTMIHGWVP